MYINIQQSSVKLLLMKLNSNNYKNTTNSLYLLCQWRAPSEPLPPGKYWQLKRLVVRVVWRAVCVCEDKCVGGRKRTEVGKIHYRLASQVMIRIFICSFWMRRWVLLSWETVGTVWPQTGSVWSFIHSEYGSSSPSQMLIILYLSSREIKVEKAVVLVGLPVNLENSVG